MIRSKDRIITTHAGSLPRPEGLWRAWASPATGPTHEKELNALLKSSVADVVRAQIAAGIDVPNDGEFGKPMRSASDLAAWGVYIFDRISGFGPAPREALAPERVVAGQPMRIVMRPLEQHKFAEFYAEAAEAMRRVVRPACVAPIKYTGEAALKRDLANLKAAASAAGVKEAFVTSIAVGSLEMFCRGQNALYPNPEAFLEGIANALAVEYRAIVDAGFLLQLDDPGLPDTWDMLDPPPSVEDYRRYAALRIEALNYALKGIPEDRVRYHICWGSWHGPHTADLPLRDIVEVMLRVNAQAYSVEAGNVRHEHEYKVWRDVKLPAGKILIPGVVSHATNVVEHPEVVADRLLDYAQIVGARTSSPAPTAGLAGACIRSSRRRSSRRWWPGRSWRAWSCGAEAR